jgi:hypothetical protein
MREGIECRFGQVFSCSPAASASAAAPAPPYRTDQDMYTVHTSSSLAQYLC